MGATIVINDAHLKESVLIIGLISIPHFLPN